MFASAPHNPSADATVRNIQLDERSVYRTFINITGLDKNIASSFGGIKFSKIYENASWVKWNISGKISTKIKKIIASVKR